MTAFTEMQELRRNVIAPHITVKTNALEIGAFTKPTFESSDINKLYVADYYTTEELKQQVEEYGGDVSEVYDVNYVLRDTTLDKQIGKKKFDLIVAHHVLEHLIDPFRWMKDMEKHLNDDGMLFISLPDKKFSFDRFRSDTNLAHFIYDFKVGGEHSLNEHCIEAGLFYDYEYSGGVNDDKSRFTQGFVDACVGSFHPGMHVHTFQMETFQDWILKPFLALGYINYELIAFAENKKYGEFSFVLRKTAEDATFDEADFYVNAYDSVTS